MTLPSQQTPEPDHAADPSTRDAWNRAARTFVQGLVVDIVGAVALVVLGAVNLDEPMQWGLLGALLGKTVLISAASYVHRKLSPPPVL